MTTSPRPGKAHLAAGVTRRAAIARTAAFAATTPTLLAACASQASPAAPTTEPVTIEFWITMAENRAPGKVVGDLNAQFTAEHPRVTINNVFGKRGDIGVLTPAFAAGVPAAGIQINAPQVWPFAGNDMLKPLNDFMRKDRPTSDAMKDFYPDVNPAFTWRDKQLFFCTDMSVEIWMINQDLFRRAGAQVPRAGWTWNDLQPLAERLRSAVPPASSFGYPFFVELPTLYRLMHWVFQNDSDILSKDRTKIIIDDPTWIEVHNHLRDLWRRELIGLAKVSTGAQPTNARLPAGVHAAELEGMTRIPAYRTDMPSSIGYMPSMTRKKRATVFDGWVEAVVNHPDGKQQQAAYELLAWHLKPEHLATRLQQTGNLPPRKAVLKERAFEQTLEKEPLQKQALEELSFARTFPMSPITADLRTRIQQATQEIVLDGKPAKETLEAARKELDVRWQAEVMSKLK